MSKVITYLQATKNFTIAEKVGQLFMPAAFINDDEKEIILLEKRIKEHHIGGICFFHSRISAATNFEGKKQVAYKANSFDTLIKLIIRFQKASKHPLLIAIDAEWGLAMRIENTPQYPYAITLGAMQNCNNLIYEVGKNIAKDCKVAGIHWNLSPVVDINNNPNNPVIGYRSFGQNKKSVVEKSLAYIQGTQSEGILCSVKHFPGHGDTDTDSHLGLPLINKTKEELIEHELYPFQKLIDHGVDSIMVGHLAVPALAEGTKTPSSLSKKMIKDVLRLEMGFKGVVISDALNMYAVSKNYPTKGTLEWLAFDAGNDILCFAENIKEGIVTIMENATIQQIEESFKRVWELKIKAILETENTQKPSPQLDLNKSSELNKKIASESLTLFEGNEKILADFRVTDFCTLTYKRFISNQKKEDVLKNLKTIKSDVAKEKDILLLLTPPQIKPTNNFGLFDEEINFINQLIRTKNVVLYLFGNPYFLNHLDTKNSLVTVIAYQNFKTFEDVATKHFLGSLKAKGKIPVTIISNF